MWNHIANVCNRDYFQAVGLLSDINTTWDQIMKEQCIKYIHDVAYEYPVLLEVTWLVWLLGATVIFNIDYIIK